MALTLLALVGAAIGVVVGHGGLVAGFLLASLVGEVLLATEGAKFLRRVSLGYTTRIVARLAVGLLWLGQEESVGPLAAGLLVGLLLVAVRSADVLAVSVFRSRGSASITGVNISLPDQPRLPVIVTGPELWRMLPSEGLVLIGLVGAAWTPWLLIASGFGVVFGALLTAMLVHAAYTLGAAKVESRVDPLIQGAVDAISPLVVLYFSGNAEAAYQVNMWLATIEKIDAPVMVVLRERSVFDALGQTRVPVLCVPDPTDLMNIDFDSVRVALYPVNVGKNIHFLRLPHIKSVFVGHGDSDKSASFNPYSRVYDEIWVAGPAGRARYARAQIGVRDEDIREVGRPQVADVARRHTPEMGNGLRTLLYAPTWEGWNEEQNYCSIEDVGLPMIQRLVAEKLPIRVIYRPHPFTGKRLRSTATANGRIKELLDTANADAGISVSAPVDVDPASTAVDAEAALAERDRKFLEETLANAHVTLLPEWGTSMSSCMIAADAMLTDVSSVLSDFLATDKPYACANPSTATESEFTEAFPATLGGYVLSRDLSNAEEFLNVVVGLAADQHVKQRTLLRTDLLGSEPEKSQETFNNAVVDLAQMADARLRRLKLIQT